MTDQVKLWKVPKRKLNLGADPRQEAALGQDQGKGRWKIDRGQVPQRRRKKEEETLLIVISRAPNTRKSPNEDLDRVPNKGKTEADLVPEKGQGQEKRSQDHDLSPPKVKRASNIRKSPNENHVLALSKEAERSLDQNPVVDPDPVPSKEVEGSQEVNPGPARSKEPEGKAGRSLAAETDLGQKKEVGWNQDPEVSLGLDPEEDQDLVLRDIQGDVNDPDQCPEKNHPRDPKVELLKSILVIHFHWSGNYLSPLHLHTDVIIVYLLFLSILN